MTIITVDDGKIQVYCNSYEQAIEYIEVLRQRGHKNFIIKENKEDEKQSTGQIREDLQEPVERYEDYPSVGL